MSNLQRVANERCARVYPRASWTVLQLRTRSLDCRPVKGCEEPKTGLRAGAVASALLSSRLSTPISAPKGKL